MTSNDILTRELKSLQDELSASERERQSPPKDETSVSGGAAAIAPAGQPEDTPEGQQLAGKLGKFLNAVVEFVEVAAKSVSAHPATKVIGALAVGILITRRIRQR